MACFILDLDDTLLNTTRDMQNKIENIKALTLVEGAKEFLKEYGSKSIVLSMGIENYQQQKIEMLYIRKLVRHVIIVPTFEKKYESLVRFSAAKKETSTEVVVVGDRVDQEIRMGNELDLITVRMRLPHGKYSHVEPGRGERPDYTVANFHELMKLPLPF